MAQQFGIQRNHSLGTKYCIKEVQRDVISFILSRNGSSSPRPSLTPHAPHTPTWTLPKLSGIQHLTLAARQMLVRQFTFWYFRKRRQQHRPRNRCRQSAVLDSILTAPGLMHADAHNEHVHCMDADRCGIGQQHNRQSEQAAAAAHATGRVEPVLMYAVLPDHYTTLASKELLKDVKGAAVSFTPLPSHAAHTSLETGFTIPVAPHSCYLEGVVSSGASMRARLRTYRRAELLAHHA